jgi:hypothetical protein
MLFVTQEENKMRIRHRVTYLWLVVGLAVSPAAMPGDAWEGTLKGGGTVRVDPTTHKPTYYYEGGSGPLWDGVHQMQDGSVVIVRDGVAVPDEDMLHTWSREASPEARERAPMCEKLVRKVCGFNDECAENRACGLARQLRRMERDEARQAPDVHTHASTQECQKGMSDEAMFPACDQGSEAVATPCGKLVARVCGEQGQCADAPACDPARQLLALEREERLDSKDPTAVTSVGRQCKDAMKNEFFAACP